jgi:tRNA A37 threonylcarbamoyladenosine dehydratase
MAEEITNTYNYHIRQQGLIHPSKLQMLINIAGAGGIGSWTMLALAKMGCRNIEIIDFDNVEAHNVGSQIYGIGDIGEPKVSSLVEKLGLFVDTENTHFSGRVNRVMGSTFEEENEIFISAVDNMSTRKNMFMGLLNKNTWFIDGRMAGNEIHIFSIKMDNKTDTDYYTENLFTDEEASPEECSERSVVYNTFIIAGFITDIVATIANGRIPPRHLTIDLRNFHMEGGFL